eukprot:COSAG06_NODE_33313_length_491_cov_800.655612_1_plen_26_part_01
MNPLNLSIASTMTAEDDEQQQEEDQE